MPRTSTIPVCHQCLNVCREIQSIYLKRVFQKQKTENDNFAHSSNYFRPGRALEIIQTSVCCVVLFWAGWNFPQKKSGSRWNEASCDKGQRARHKSSSPPVPYELPGEPRVPVRAWLKATESVWSRCSTHKEMKLMEASNQPRVKSPLTGAIFSHWLLPQPYKTPFKTPHPLLRISELCFLNFAFFAFSDPPD